MKILIVESSPHSKTAFVTVHVRNSVILANYLKQNHDCRLVSNESDISDIHEQFDFIIFVSATFYFQYARFLELMKNQKNCKILYLTNEYELFMQDFLKQYGIDGIITNFEEHGIKKAHTYKKFLMTNLNSLQAKVRNPSCGKLHDMCYYGTWRKRRTVYFQKYLIKDMILSTSSKNLKKFLLDGCDCWVTDRFTWQENMETLNLFRSTLYIEDTFTHKCYNHLANRFYEGLFCNSIVFFDKTCQNTIQKSNYFIPSEFIIDSYDEMVNKLQHIDAQLVEQFLTENTNKALIEKAQTLRQIEQFLVNF